MSWMWPEAPGTEEPELRETHFTALLCNLQSQKHFWESKPFIIHTAFLARWVLMLMAFRNHSVICRSVTSFLEACCNFRKIRFTELLRRNRDAEHFSMAGRHRAVSSPNCSFAFNIFRNFLKKVDLNSYINSVPLEMLIYQNYVLVYSELSVAFFFFSSFSLPLPFTAGQNSCHVKKEQSKLGRGEDLLWCRATTTLLLEQDFLCEYDLAAAFLSSLDQVLVGILPQIFQYDMKWIIQPLTLLFIVLRGVITLSGLGCFVLFCWMCFGKQRHYPLSLKVLL